MGKGSDKGIWHRMKLTRLKLLQTLVIGSGYFAVDGNLPSETILP